MTVHHVAVVGAGMAAARFAQQFSARTGGAARLTLYGAEPHAPYNRTLLADVLTGRYDEHAVGLPYGPDAEVRTGTRVTAVDPATRTLTLDDGSAARYDTLVLATGAAPVPPDLPGPHGALPEGVHVLRTLADCRGLADDARRVTRAVVVGGGVLGVSAARALAALGLRTAIVHRAPHLMERHLDPAPAGALRRHLEALGIAVHTGATARALHGTGRVTAVELPGGRHLRAGLVVFACGVRPRTGLARAAGLTVRRGVVVDDHLATSAPGVHAVGDCAEHRGIVHGLADPAWQQADVLAARLSGADPRARYTGTRPHTRLTAGSLQLAAFGDPGTAAAGPRDVLSLADATRGTYKQLVLDGDRLASAVLLGDLTTAGDLIRAWRHDEPLPADPSRLLVPEGAHP
ncbi:nitrite reductase [Streptomyces cinnamoneus]|uniref:Nitrite reductase n=1 Tax=Streptomyces cinnamoneus TaxID=53446 RepID=A0A2G1XNQ1_STRCJ|nr:FAD-dependent oxidoreductase [Streptomyces cinnamoneus]PHQ52867.1 nitrite reductase [Streptomyces cinnamoneus]PPT11473.1 NAD(P)/FAD-dependent oxidoreductase [Streptomyces cinnamoneus]